MVLMSYCVKCGNTGIDINGNVCTCRANVESIFEAVSCLDVPEQYRGLKFNKALLPKDLNEAYGEYLQSVYDKMLVGKWQQHNVVIASPIGHGKSILAYSCLENLFRRGLPTFPLFDVLELKRIIFDMDTGRKQGYSVENPEELITVPILFVRIPRLSTREVYDTMSVILDRRVRRGNSTIFLYSGSWSYLVNGDKSGLLQGMVGDGSFGTVEVKSWYTGDSTPIETKFDLPENLG